MPRMESRMEGRYTIATHVRYSDGWTERVLAFVDAGIPPAPVMDAKDVSIAVFNPSPVTCQAARYDYLTPDA